MKLVAAKCPSCGANIKVDRSLKVTKCEYCDTEIMVEEAVENLLKVELKDTPSLENYLKLGNRYFDNREFEEAYKVYSKAEEIDPDIPIVVLRRGLCRSMIADYNHFDVSSAIKAMKTAYDLMKKMKLSNDEILVSINDTGTVLFSTYQYVVDVYKNNRLNKEQTKGYIDRLEECLKGYQYLDGIVEGDQELQDRILNSMIIIIDTILGSDSKYQLSSSYVSELNQKKKEYSDRRTKVMVKPSFHPSEKVVGVQGKTTIIWDILCYITIAFLFLMFLGSIFNYESILVIILWLLTLISFIPQIKRALIQKNGSKMGIIVIITRIVLFVTVFILFAGGPMKFENTYRGEDGVKITIKEGKFTIIDGDEKTTSTYHWDSQDDDYYITVKGKNGEEDFKYRYRSSDEGGSLCLLENDKCTTIYLPVE